MANQKDEKEVEKREEEVEVELWRKRWKLEDEESTDIKNVFRNAGSKFLRARNVVTAHDDTSALCKNEINGK